ncbi:carbohydrate binding domain-containing protein [Bacillus spongiae]|uniref:Carbohydrate binding domain-containing protein n=1 Tax=Bacillus spongiae TaxID=2683610 RepID=A0ABU8HEU2_9BACI
MKKRITSITMVFILLLGIVSNFAPTTALAAAYHDTGSNPSIALSDSGVAIEVHEGGLDNKLFFNVGKVTNGEVVWKNGKDNGENYDKGIDPYVAISPNGKYVVEVHENNNAFSRALYYNVGKITDGGDLVWIKGKDNGTQYDDGVSPTVAVNNDGTVVEIHKHQNNGGLYFNIGKVNDDGTITWDKGKDSGTYFDTGDRPSVTLTADGTVVEVHEAPTSSSKLFYNIGKVNHDTGNIDWNKGKDSGTFYDDGYSPSVSINADGIITEVHLSSKFESNKLMNNMGVLTGDTIYWYSVNSQEQKAPSYDTGNNPSVAINNHNQTVEIHQGTDGTTRNNTLYTSVATVKAKEMVGFALYDGTSNGKEFDEGDRPSLAMTDSGTVLEVHYDLRFGDSGSSVYFNGGTLNSDGKINWWKGTDSGTRYGYGSFPSVAMSEDGTIVEVHEDGAGSSKMYYTIGKLDEESKSIQLNADNAIYFADGTNPQIELLEDGTVIETHVKDEKLYYNLGVLNKEEEKIYWYKEDPTNSNKTISTLSVDGGVKPSITATNDGKVVQVFRIENRSSFDRFLENNQWLAGFADYSGNILFYMTGEIVGDTINWNDAQKYGTFEGKTSAYQTDMDINDDGSIIETHFSADSLSHPNNLYYRTGKLVDDLIEWTSADIFYDTGRYPTISLNNEGKIVTLHNSEVGQGIFSNTGELVSLKYPNAFVDQNPLLNAKVDIPTLKLTYPTDDYMNMSIASDGTAVSVYENTDGGLSYQLGNAEGDNVQWITDYPSNEVQDGKDEIKYSPSGHKPSVVITDDKAIIETHIEGVDDLVYNIGHIIESDGKKVIKWNKPRSDAFMSMYTVFGKGTETYVDIMSDGTVVETHNDGKDNISYSIGEYLQTETLGIDLFTSNDTDEEYISGITRNISQVPLPVIKDLDANGNPDPNGKNVVFGVKSAVENQLFTDDVMPFSWNTDGFIGTVIIDKDSNYANPDHVEKLKDEINQYQKSIEQSFYNAFNNLLPSIDQFTASNATDIVPTDEWLFGRGVYKLEVDGTTTKQNIRQVVSEDSILDYLNKPTVGNAINSREFTYSVYLKADVPNGETQPVTLRLRDKESVNVVEQTFNVTNEWQEYSVSKYFNQGSDDLRVFLYPKGKESSEAGYVYAAAAQLRETMPDLDKFRTSYAKISEASDQDSPTGDRVYEIATEKAFEPTAKNINRILNINPKGQEYTYSVWLKDGDLEDGESQPVTLKLIDSFYLDRQEAEKTVNITNQWKEYSVTGYFAKDGEFLEIILYPTGLKLYSDINDYVEEDATIYATGSTLTSKVPELFTRLDNSDIEYETIIWKNVDVDKEQTGTVYTTGNQPSIAVNDDGHVVATMHNDGKVYYNTGQLQDDAIEWDNTTEDGTFKPIELDKGWDPIVDIDRSGNIAVFYNTIDSYSYAIGHYSQGTLDWDKKGERLSDIEFGTRDIAMAMYSDSNQNIYYGFKNSNPLKLNEDVVENVSDSADEKYYSRFSDTDWQNSGITIDDGSLTAPNGTPSQKLTQTELNGRIQQFVDIDSDGKTYTFGVWMKADEPHQAQIKIQNRHNTESTGIKVDVTTDWKYFSVTSDQPFSTNDGVTAVLWPSAYNNGATNSVYVWGTELIER